MSAYPVHETWKPTCRNRLEGLFDVLRIHADRCKRKQGHSGRCVGTYLVWDHDEAAQLQKRLQGSH